ncbi:MAG: T9SS type A sorting domain-containing protein, partial [Bacteroidales bacterium]|nr:T9SS type A sorting domain-containing protein [Bacteroidales bacterium]
TTAYIPSNGFNSREICCPSLLNSGGGGGGGIEDEKTAFSVAGTNGDSVQSLLNQLVDGGSTDQLTTNVQTSMPPDAVPVYDDLMLKSPYLSDSVMIAAVNKEDVFSSSMVTEILSANPQAAKSEAVMTEVEFRMNPLTEDQKTQINEGLYEFGGKEILEAQLANYRLDRSYSLGKILNYYSGDSLSLNPIDSMLSYLTISNNIWSKYHEAFLRAQIQDTSGTEVILTIIPQMFSLSQSQQTEHLHYTQFIGIMQDLLHDSLSMLHTDSLTIQTVNVIKQSSEGIMQVYARNLLYGIQGYSDYVEPYQLPQPGNTPSNVRWQSPKPVKKNSLKLYPNPAQNYAIAEYYLKETSSNCLLKIYNYSGQLLMGFPATGAHGYINLSFDKHPAGVYICSLECENTKLESVRLVVAK